MLAGLDGEVVLRQRLACRRELTLLGELHEVAVFFEVSALDLGLCPGRVVLAHAEFAMQFAAVDCGRELVADLARVDSDVDGHGQGSWVTCWVAGPRLAGRGILGAGRRSRCRACDGCQSPRASASHEVRLGYEPAWH
ncbi:hypothetical protein D3C71_1605720 [compost metagenome]